MTYKPDKHQTKALETWYPIDHSLHFQYRHPLLKLVGEIGEFIDDWAKADYKPSFEWSREIALDELGDIWYYCRILSYQIGEPSTSEYGGNSTTSPDLLLSIMITNSAKMLDEFLSIGEWLPKHLRIAIGMLKQLLSQEFDCLLDELTDLNYTKLVSKSGMGKHGWKTIAEYGNSY